MSKHVKVKPLEWLQISDTQWYANTIYDPYFVRRLGEEWVWNLYGYPISESATKTLKEAQDAAQSDYESRILSALEPSPAFEAMVEALEGLVKCCEEHDAAIASVMGKPPGWKDAYLDTARAALASVKGEQA